MKKIFLYIVFSWGCLLDATWRVGTIFNNSDLIFDGAYYISPKEKEITVLTDKIKKEVASDKTSIPIDYTVSDTSSGCSLLRAYTQNGDTTEFYSLVLDGNPAHALHRAKAKKGKRNKRFVCKDFCKYGSYCARIFLDHDIEHLHEQVACAGAEYIELDTLFDIVINKSGNSYTVELRKPQKSKPIPGTSSSAKQN